MTGRNTDGVVVGRKRKYDDSVDKPAAAGKKTDHAVNDAIDLTLDDNLARSKRKRLHGGSSQTDPIVIGDLITTEEHGTIFEISDEEEPMPDIITAEEEDSIFSIDDDDEAPMLLERELPSEEDSEPEQDTDIFLVESESQSDEDSVSPVDLSIYAAVFDPLDADSSDEDLDLLFDFALLESTDSSQDEDEPGISWSQDSARTDVPDTPASSQTSLSINIANIFESGGAEELPALEDTPAKIAAERARQAKERIEKTKLSKRLFFYEYFSTQYHELKRRVDLYLDALPKDRSEDSCWLYSGPRLPKAPARTIRSTVCFKHEGKRHKVDLNIGFISLLLEGVMTQEQKEGIIEHQWHASHLCGNWTCLNWRHIQPEEGLININRNSCFPQVDKPCTHSPQCLRHLKVDLEILRPVPKEAPTPSQEEDEGTIAEIEA